MTRNRTRLTVALSALLVVSLVATAAVVPAAASGSSGPFTSAATAQTTFGVWTPSDDLIRFGADGHPGWVVSYENDSADDLRRWVNASTSREIRQHVPASRTMVISAPASHVGATWAIGVNALKDRPYVDGPIGITREVGVDPITESELEDEESWSRPAGYWGATVGGLNGELSPDGATWGEDVNASSLADVRESIGADEVAENGSGVTVAVLDTGINYDQDLYGDRLTGKNILSGEEINGSLSATQRDYSKVSDGDGHGTHVATTIAGDGNAETGTGVAPGADLLAVKVLADDGSGSTADIAEGLDYACREQSADVISMSLGSALPSEQINQEVEKCLNQHGASAVIVAAGNNRLTYRYVASPADDSATISVAASDALATNESRSAYFSAVGPDPATGEGPDLAAPGLKITAETDVGNRTLSGTSMAAPVVSGTVALMLEADGTLEGDQEAIRLRLEDTADPLPKAGTTEVGEGRLNAHNAVADDPTDGTQESERSSEAAARDSANGAVAGSAWRVVSSSVTGIVG